MYWLYYCRSNTLCWSFSWLISPINAMNYYFPCFPFPFIKKFHKMSLHEEKQLVYAYKIFSLVRHVDLPLGGYINGRNLQVYKYRSSFYGTLQFFLNRKYQKLSLFLLLHPNKKNASKKDTHAPHQTCSSEALRPPSPNKWFGLAFLRAGSRPHLPGVGAPSNCSFHEGNSGKAQNGRPWLHHHHHPAPIPII